MSRNEDRAPSSRPRLQSPGCSQDPGRETNLRIETLSSSTEPETVRVHDFSTRLWRVELQRFADASGLDISGCHFPPGTSKWNKIEHRLFSHITQNWRGRPLVSRETVVELIRATTTKSGLRVRAKLDTRTYEVKKVVTEQQLELVNIHREHFRGDWNYTVRSVKRER